jgi:exonuclease SbcC
MIPVKLTLQGIYSYQEKQVIDFTRLTGEHLFGIFGPVGSGKSAILEAITLALYGETERLNQQDKRNYNMMNLKSKELIVDFEFFAGKNNTELFAFTVNGKRDKKQFDVVRAFERAAYTITGGERLPIDVRSIKDIVGLSYENFKRTIIIPQGKFQEFLQLTENLRSTMLKQIFNLHKFDLSDKTAAIEIKNKSRLHVIEGELKGIGLVTEEQMTETRNELSTENRERQAADQELAKKIGAANESESLARLFDKLSEARVTVARLESEEQGFSRRERTLRDYEQCVVQFKEVLKQKEKLDASIGEASGSLEVKRGVVRDLNSELVLREADLSRSKIEYERREELKEEADDLANVLLIRGVTQSLKSLKESIARKSGLVEGSVKQMEQLRNRLTTLRSELQTKKEELPDQGELADILKWFTTRGHLLEQEGQAQETLKGISNDIAEILRKKATILGKKGLGRFIREAQFSLEFEEISRLLAEAKKAQKADLKTMQAQLQQLGVQKKLGVLAGDLRPGVPCLICGAVDHPKVMVAQNIERDCRDLEKKVADVEEDVDTIDAAMSEITGISTSHQNATRRLGAQRVAVETAAARLKEHLDTFVWKAFDAQDEHRVQAEFKRARDIESQIKEHESKSRNTETEIRKAENAKESLTKDLENDNRNQAAEQSAYSTLEKQLKKHSLEEYEKLTDLEAKSRLSKLKTRYSDIEKQFRELDKQVKFLSENANTLKGQLETGEEQLNESREKQEQLATEVQDRLVKSGFPSVANVLKILGTEIDVKTEHKAINTFREAVHTAAEKCADLESETQGKSYDAEAHRSLQREIEQERKDLKERSERVGELNARLEKMQKDLDSRNGLVIEQKRLEDRAKDLDVLKSLFRGNGFVNYVSTVYLKSICHAANLRFSQLTRQKLHLELNDDNSFQVRDFMNDGKQRSVKTLSGGQMFQASLSLAIALGDQIQQLANAGQNFFFLDEGFGSLDKDSLETVFSTLASLRKENRIVGVISHVTELQQEIECHLRVKNTDEHGTLIENSWS